MLLFLIAYSESEACDRIFLNEIIEKWEYTMTIVVCIKYKSTTCSTCHRAEQSTNVLMYVCNVCLRAYVRTYTKQELFFWISSYKFKKRLYNSSKAINLQE